MEFYTVKSDLADSRNLVQIVMSCFVGAYILLVLLPAEEIELT